MQGMVAVGNMAGKPVHPINRNRIPGATYTEPGIGSVGLTEAQAQAAGYDVKVGKFPFSANSKATILGSHDGFVKVVADAKYGEILGVHIIGPQAYELISEAVTAMEAGSHRRDHDAHDPRASDHLRSRRRSVQQRLRPGDQCMTASKMRNYEFTDLGNVRLGTGIRNPAGPGRAP